MKELAFALFCLSTVAAGMVHAQQAPVDPAREKVERADERLREFQEAQITDPTVFVKPVEMRFTLKRVPADQQILEYSCLEGERSLQHYTEEDGGKKVRVK